MAAHDRQMRQDSGEAARQLRERLAREEMGDAAYTESRSHADDRSFRIFGVVFIALFALAILGIVLLES